MRLTARNQLAGADTEVTEGCDDDHRQAAASSDVTLAVA